MQALGGVDHLRVGGVDDVEEADVVVLAVAGPAGDGLIRQLKPVSANKVWMIGHATQLAAESFTASFLGRCRLEAS